MPWIVALVGSCAFVIVCALTRVTILVLAHVGIHASLSISPSSFLRSCLNFFLISTSEESSQTTKHANKSITFIFWLWRPQFLAHTIQKFAFTLIYTTECTSEKDSGDNVYVLYGYWQKYTFVIVLTVLYNFRWHLLVQCPPLNRITLGQRKSDNNNRIIQLTN